VLTTLLTPHLKLTPEQELKCRISVKQAAEIKNVSVATFRKRYAHLIERVGARRIAVKLGDVLD
jgi:hypothetical protein